MKANLTFIAMLLQVITLNSYAQDNWQVSQSGIQYQVEGIDLKQNENVRQAFEEWQKHTVQLYRALSKSGVSISEFNYRQQPFSKVEFGVVFRYDADWIRKEGVVLIAVSPNGLMQRLGLRNNDIIQKINGTDLTEFQSTNDKGQSLAAIELMKQLKALKEGDDLNVVILREGKKLVIRGEVDSFNLPELTLSSKAIENQPSNCGWITVLDGDFVQRGRKLYEAEIVSINGERQRNPSQLKLAPGEYILEIREHILASDVSSKVTKGVSGRFNTDHRIKQLSLRVAAGMRYEISAKLDGEQSRIPESYWHPRVVSKPRECRIN